MPQTEMAGLRADVLRGALVRRLGEAGVPDPAAEARVLLAEVANLESGTLVVDPPVVTAAACERVERAMERRMAGEPLAYVVGTAGFRTLLLRVDRRVLIPRPETEGLVEHVLHWSRRRWGAAGWGTAVDCGTGSGCIALSLAAEGAFRSVLGLDASADALTVARDNAAATLPGRRVVWGRASMTECLRPASVDVLVSNPPYIAAAEMETLDGAVRDYEPSMALESGTDGLIHTRWLVQDARRVLAPGGLLAVEIDARRAEASRREALAAGWGDVTIAPDLFGRPRYLLTERE